MFLINGKEKKIVSVIDRGIRFGDGCFTTIAVLNSKIILLSAHLERLHIACKRLGITFLYWDQLEEEIQFLAYGKQRVVLNVLITRGSSLDGGYSIKSCTEPTRIIRISSWPDYYDDWRDKGIILGVSPIRLGRNPHLAGLKHLNRLEQVLIYTYLERVKADEVLVLDSNGWIIECCTANIFWRKNNIVYTPCLDQAGVNGVMRQFFLRALESSPFHVVETRSREKALICADEIIICNSLMSVIPVRMYGKKKFSSRNLFNFLSPLCPNINLA